MSEQTILRFVEFPQAPVYHYAEPAPSVLPLCHCKTDADYIAPFVVETRSSGRRLCWQCQRDARHDARKRPGMSAWEAEQAQQSPAGACGYE